jgi:hypothetical protein
MDARDTYAPHADALFTEFPDGTGVLLHLKTKFYFSLNRSGVTVWKALAAGGGQSAAALALALTQAFEVSEEAAAADVQALLGEMAAEGLVKKTPA